MRWLESQLETRAKNDAALTERAYAKLAASVSDVRRAPRFTPDEMEQADGVVKACLKYNRVMPGSVPDDVTDIEERMEWLCRPSATMRRNVRLGKDWYKQAVGAMASRLDTGEAIALLPATPYGYYYLEPGTGRKCRVNAERARHISEDAVLFYRPLPTRELKVRDLVAFIVRVFDRNDYLLVFLAALFSTLVGLFPAWANNLAFGMVVPSGSARLVLPIGALLVGVIVSSSLIGACRNLVMTRVATKVSVTCEAAVFGRFLALPSAAFKDYASGDLASRLYSVTALVQVLVSVLLGAGLTTFLSIIYVAQIGFYAPQLALPAFLTLLVQAALTVLATFVIARFERESLQAMSKLSGTVTALLSGIQKVKLAGAESRAFAQWANGYATYAQAMYNRPAIARALPAIVTFIGLVGTVVIYFLAGSTHVDVASYMAFNAAFGQATAAVMSLANTAGQIAQIRPMLDMIEPIMEAAPETAEDKPSVSSLNGGIEMSGVSFRYNENTPYILQDLSFKVRPGEYVAIVGKSGCGKSTILRLLLGFEKPESGSIFYGIYDVQKVDLRSLRQHIGTVMQNGKLFMGDIASNITISASNATLDDAWEAAEIAGVADDIRKMPMGMHTLVTEGGGGVSGGQRQRLMIARAVCGKRRILMFDEATSALDNVTQKHVSDSLEQLNCTRVVVAHRLSTVRHCDRILVVDGGKIAEEGTYEELLAKGGLFAELVERQRLDSTG